MLKRYILIGIAVAMLTIPTTTWAAGILGQEKIPVDMVIDKIVVLTIDPPRILLSQVAAKTWEGATSVHMGNNFPVIVSSAIIMVGPSLGTSANYRCDIAPTTGALVLAGAGSTDSQSFASAPPPVGITFYIGARIDNLDISYAPSGTTAQQVAEILLTVHDAL